MSKGKRFHSAMPAAMLNSVFIIVQRYNRPRITAILERRARRIQSREQA